MQWYSSDDQHVYPSLPYAERSHNYSSFQLLGDIIITTGFDTVDYRAVSYSLKSIWFCTKITKKANQIEQIGTKRRVMIYNVTNMCDACLK